VILRPQSPVVSSEKRPRARHRLEKTHGFIRGVRGLVRLRDFAEPGVNHQPHRPAFNHDGAARKQADGFLIRHKNSNRDG
jgi:hypothetical protein